MDHNTFPPSDGRQLAARRKAAGVNQDAVASRIGTTRQALSRWERNPALSYVKARRYVAALTAAVEEAA